MADEQVVPCKLGHHPDVQAVGWVRAAKQVLYEIIATFHVGEHVFVERVEPFGRHRGVVVPPDRINDVCGFHHVLIFGRTTGVFSGSRHESATLAECSFAAFNRLLDDRRFKQVVIDRPEPGNALGFQRVRWVNASDDHDLAPAGVVPL